MRRTIGLNICILLCLFLEVKSNNVKIFGTGYRDAVPDQYIVALSTQKPEKRHDNLQRDKGSHSEGIPELYL